MSNTDSNETPQRRSMFPAKSNTKTGLDKLIDAALADIQTKELHSEEYEQALNHLERLYKLQSKNAPPTVSPDTVMTVLAHLLGITIIVGYEHKHIVTSKALNFVMKLR